MPGLDDEDSDTLLALDDDESSDDGGRTLVVDRGAGERTQLETPLARLARKQAIEQAGLAPFRHVPAAGAPARPVPPETTAPFPRPQVDAADPERRVLPFSVGMQAPLSAPPPPNPAHDAGRASYADGFIPLTETLAMSSAPAMPRAQAPVTMGETPNPPARPARPMMPSPPPPRAPAPSAHAMAPVAMGGTPIAPVAPVAPSAGAVVAPPPPAPRPRQDSVALAPETGTPPLVIRFLLVCGLLTALGLFALVYLEI